jgi:putative transposase
MIKTFKFRIYPNQEQVRILDIWLNECRFIYNDCLNDRTNAYERTGKSVTYNQQSSQLKYLDLNCYKTSAQKTLDLLDKAFQNFFRRVKQSKIPGYPRFKGENRFKSIYIPNNGFKNLDGNKIQIGKSIGIMKMDKHRNIIGKVKTIQIKKSGDNKWYIIFACEISVEKKVEINNAVGIDLGLTTLATLSDGTEFENIRAEKKYQAKIRKEQKRLVRKVSKSNNYNKQKIKLNKVYTKITNTRNDYLHKVSRLLVDKYDLIVFEDLNIKNMVDNNYLAKSIHDASWNKLVNYTTYKAEETGKIVKLVNPKFTTMECSNCGNIKQMKLDQRQYICPKCGLNIKRDLNAAINILMRLGQSFKLLEIKPMLFTISLINEGRSNEINIWKNI